ncbi:hypothetical protein GS491_26445 [Rhodococcus hoagii]|nr:hypothetical protein [Prescottella equi]NKR80661.1 hypothetical protein [Prescottella equi]NKS99590.1 hypothetical protein [Prescottella equi]
MFTTMRTEGVNCGTIWAASDTWTFKSTYDGPDGYFRNSRSPEASVRAAVDDLWADMERGSDVVDAVRVSPAHLTPEPSIASMS